MNTVQPSNETRYGRWTLYEYDEGACPCGVKFVLVQGDYATVEEAQEAVRQGAYSERHYW